MKYILCSLFILGISGTQCHEPSCSDSADCQSICDCWQKKKTLNTSQTQSWNKECHKCKAPGRMPTPMAIFPPPKVNDKEDTEKNEDK